MDLTTLKAALNPAEAHYLEQKLSQPIKSIAEDLDVQLTEDEIATALIEAKQKKRAILKYEANEILRQKKAKEIMQSFSATELIQYCLKFYNERFEMGFIIDKTNENIVKELSLYFSNDPEFNRGELSLKKGIMLIGNVGCGKTSLLAFFQKNKKRCFTIKSCNDIAEDFMVHKDDVEKIYSIPIEKPLHDPSVFFQKYIGYCFDDLGTEEVKNSFGNKKNVMADLLLAIYNKKNFSDFHLTTNLVDKDIETKYGSRVFSRLKEMFNIFYMNHPDRREWN